MNSKNLLLLPSLAILVFLLSSIDAASILECPPHSTFNGCMSRCPKTCQNIDLPPTNCISACSVGCECLEGFVKVAKGATSQCVKAYECPMYTTKQSTLPYPVLRKLAAAASVPANQAVLNLNLTTLAMVGTGSGSGSTGSIGSHRPTTAAMMMMQQGSRTTSASAAASAVSSTIAVLRKVKQARPEENESHED